MIVSGRLVIATSFARKRDDANSRKYSSKKVAEMVGQRVDVPVKLYNIE
jgi:hypothetical protein